MLKADFHAHTRQMQNEANYRPEELIDKAAELGYDVLTISEHYDCKSDEEEYRANPLANFQKLSSYAEKKGILLIAGVEAEIEGKEILVLNIKGDVRDYLKTFNGLKQLKMKCPSIFIIAPHPYFVKSNCLKDRMLTLLDVIDAIEYCHFYLSFFNLNKKAVKFAKKYKKPMVGTSDAHRFVQLDKTYTLVDAEKNINSIVDAVKKGKVKVETRPLKITEFAEVCLFILRTSLKKLKRTLTRPFTKKARAQKTF